MSLRALRDVQTFASPTVRHFFGNNLTMSNNSKTTGHKIAKEGTSPDAGG